MSKELEALEALKIIKEIIIPSSRSDWETDYYYVSGIKSTKKIFNFIEEALKRNEPMKVRNRMSDIHNCPNCGVMLFDDVEQTYCDLCGQKLYWSDEDE